MKRQRYLVSQKGTLFLLMMGFSSLSLASEQQIGQWGVLLHDVLVFLVGAFIASGFVYKQFIRDRKQCEKKNRHTKKNHQLKRSHKICCIG